MDYPSVYHDIRLEKIQDPVKSVLGWRNGGLMFVLFRGSLVSLLNAGESGGI